MILVDSSVWIDYFRGTPTPEAEKLDALLGSEPVITGDLVLVDVLQGFDSERDFNQARKLLTSLEVTGQACVRRCPTSVVRILSGTMK